jgi:hypothetical protein
METLDDDKLKNILIDFYDIINENVFSIVQNNNKIDIVLLKDGKGDFLGNEKIIYTILKNVYKNIENINNHIIELNNNVKLKKYLESYSQYNGSLQTYTPNFNKLNTDKLNIMIQYLHIIQDLKNNSQDTVNADLIEKLNDNNDNNNDNDNDNNDDPEEVLKKSLIPDKIIPDNKLAEQKLAEQKLAKKKLVDKKLAETKLALNEFKTAQKDCNKLNALIEKYIHRTDLNLNIEEKKNKHNNYV